MLSIQSDDVFHGYPIYSRNLTRTWEMREFETICNLLTILILRRWVVTICFFLFELFWRKCSLKHVIFKICVLVESGTSLLSNTIVIKMEKHEYAWHVHGMNHALVIFENMFFDGVYWLRNLHSSCHQDESSHEVWDNVLVNLCLSSYSYLIIWMMVILLLKISSLWTVVFLCLAWSHLLS